MKIREMYQYQLKERKRLISLIRFRRHAKLGGGGARPRQRIQIPRTRLSGLKGCTIPHRDEVLHLVLHPLKVVVSMPIGKSKPERIGCPTF